MLGLHSVNILLVQSGKNKRLTPNHQGPSPELSVIESDAIDRIMCIILRKISLEEKNDWKKIGMGRKCDCDFQTPVLLSKFFGGVRSWQPWGWGFLERQNDRSPQGRRQTVHTWPSYHDSSSQSLPGCAASCCPIAQGCSPALTSVNTDRANYLWVGMPTSIWTNSL